jgi:hypothetical protein
VALSTTNSSRLMKPPRRCLVLHKHVQQVLARGHRRRRWYYEVRTRPTPSQMHRPHLKSSI